MTGDPRQRAIIARDLAWALYLANHRMEDVVSVLETALEGLGDTDQTLAETIEALLLSAGGLQLSTGPAHRQRLARVHEQKLGDVPASDCS